MNNYFSCPFEYFTTRAAGTNNGIVFVYTTHVFVVVLVCKKFTFLATLSREVNAEWIVERKNNSFFNCKRTNKTLPYRLKLDSPRFKFTSFINFGYLILCEHCCPTHKCFVVQQVLRKVFVSAPIVNIQMVTLSEKI